MISLKLENTSFKSTSHCFNPDQGKSIILPIGFGIQENIDIKTIEKEDAIAVIKCPIFTCMLKEPEEYNLFTKKNKLNIQYYKLYEKYLYFVSNIYRSYLYKLNIVKETIPYSSYRGTEDDEIPTVFFSMNSDSKSGLIANSLGMNKARVTRMVNFMIKYKFLEMYSEQHSFIDYSKGESIVDLKCRHFIVSSQLYRSPVKYQVRTQDIIDRLQEQYDKILNEALTGEGKSFEAELLSDDAIRSYTFPSVEKLVEIATKKVANKEKDKYGRIYNFGIPPEWYSEDNGKTVTKKKANGELFTYTIRGKLKPDCPYVDINVHIYNYILMMNGPKVIRKRQTHYNENRFYKDRFYCFLSMIPKWIRNEIQIDGERTEEIDAQALHPRILGKLYEDAMGEDRPDFLTGDSHTKIAEMLEITRESAKLISLSYWNSKIIGNKTSASKKNSILFNKMDEYIIENHPSLFTFLKQVKCDKKAIKKRKSSHTNMSVLLLDVETQIMENLFWDIQYSEHKTPFIYCYDSVTVKQSKAGEVKKMFDNMLKCILEV